jgi:hypothetical protein
MPIRPIDVLRTQEASQLKQIENHKSQHTQDHLSKNFQTMIRQEQRRPTETTKSDNHEYRYDAKEKGQNQYKGSNGKKNDNKENKEETKVSKEPSKGGNFDILI